MKRVDAAPRKVPRSPTRPETKPTPRPPRIPVRPLLLFADEDLGLYAALSVAFHRYFDSNWAPTNSDAFRSTVDTAPDLVIIEDARPVIDPLWVIHAVRARQPQCPVVLTSGQGNPCLIRDVAPLGVSGFLRKPMDILEFVRLVSHLIKPPEGDQPLPSVLSGYVSKTVEYISRHYQDATVKGVASTIGVSYGHLAHLVHAELGLTLGDYIAQVRIEVCKLLLVKTDHKLDHIAESVGFCDAPHLSRRFREYVGRRPGEYRRQPTPCLNGNSAHP
jgi:YesN/AraC family two-component response regulator